MTIVDRQATSCADRIRRSRNAAAARHVDRGQSTRIFRNLRRISRL